MPAKSVAELVALLKSQPDKLTFSSGGFGTPAHLIGEMFKLQTGTRATHVPYQQFPQAIGDLLNGTNQFMFITTLPVVDLIAAGKLRALAVTGPKRVPALQGRADHRGAGLPGSRGRRLGRLRGEARHPDDDRGAAERGDQQGAGEGRRCARRSPRSAPSPPAARAASFGNLVKAQVAHWGKVVKDSGIKMQQ